MSGTDAVVEELPRRRWHRVLFVLAGVYNLAWGAYAGLDPQWLFRFARMPAANHPAIFACLGMVVGLYGLVYLEIARVPERGWPLAAVGLVGKVLGPAGLAVLIARGQWPMASLVLCLTNDLVWSIPSPSTCATRGPSSDASCRPHVTEGGRLSWHHLPRPSGPGLISRRAVRVFVRAWPCRSSRALLSR